MAWVEPRMSKNILCEGEIMIKRYPAYQHYQQQQQQNINNSNSSNNNSKYIGKLSTSILMYLNLQKGLVDEKTWRSC
eukprot:12516871-Ditylum_brightwellii.AAC.1